MDGTSIQPTTHRSSSGTSSVADRDVDVAESEICEDCVGIRYCAYDHSDSKYLGRGRYGARGEKVDCRFLQKRINGLNAHENHILTNGLKAKQRDVLCLYHSKHKVLAHLA